jgi:hypothetical protein
MVSTSTSASVLDAGFRASDQTGTAPLERRRHKRYFITLLGRFMRENKQEYPCKLRDISVGGAAIMSPVDLEIGERIVAYFDHIGGLEGSVVRTFDGGFAIELNATPYKREKIANQLVWLSNRSSNSELPQRRHDRFSVNDQQTTLRLDEGISIPVRVLDVSISGSSVETEARPPLGTEVILGKLRARVVRYHESGLGLQFIDIQNPDALRRYFG